MVSVRRLGGSMLAMLGRALSSATYWLARDVGRLAWHDTGPKRKEASMVNVSRALRLLRSRTPLPKTPCLHAGGRRRLSVRRECCFELMASRIAEVGAFRAMHTCNSVKCVMVSQRILNWLWWSCHRPRSMHLIVEEASDSSQLDKGIFNSRLSLSDDRAEVGIVTPLMGSQLRPLTMVIEG